MEEFDVHISFKYIRYTEGTQIIELDVEPCIDKTYIYIPTERAWNKIFGAWASGRRIIILERIKKEIMSIESFEVIDVDLDYEVFQKD